MKVICPSYGRTGTKSMQAALDILGFGPCYDMILMMRHHWDHTKLWQDGYDGRDLLVAEIFKDYESVTDWPASDFYKEIIQEYPDAKVILTLRDPKSWWESIIATIHRKDGPYARAFGLLLLLVLFPPSRNVNAVASNISVLYLGEEDAKAAYVRHNAEVKALVPVDKLLEFSVKEGWEPLCAFLGVPVPEVPFPRVNSSAEILKWYARFNRIAWVAAFGALVLGGVIVWVALLVGGKGAGIAIAAIELSAFSYGVMETLRVIRPKLKSKMT